LIQKYIHLIFFSFVLYFSSIAQQLGKQSHFTSIISSYGISNNSVNAITQDGEGFYWFATDNGLCRYDGAQITVFKNKINDKFSLPNNRVFDLTIDSKGTLWLATDNGIANYDSEHNHFIRYNFNNKNTPNQHVTSIKVFDNTIWFTTTNQLCKINLATKKIQTIQVPSNAQNQFPYIYSMYIDIQGRIWMCIDGYLYSYDSKTSTFTEITVYSNIIGSNKNQFISAYQSDNNGIWFGTVNGKIYRYITATNSFREIQVENSTKPTDVSALFFDNTGKLYVVIDKKGIGLLDEQGTRFSLIGNSYFNLIDNCSILCAYVDKQQNVWFGHKKAGVCYVAAHSTFDLINTQYEQGKYLKCNIVSSFLFDNQQNQWLGTDGGGLYKRESDKKGYFIPQTQITSDCILSMFQDSKGTIWVGTYQDGLFMMDKNGKLLNHFTKTKGNGIASNDIRAITEDKNGILWFTIHSAGFSSFNIKTGQWTNYSSQNKSEIVGDWTYDILCASDNRIWVASNYGLYCIENNRQTIKGYFTNGNNTSLSNNRVYCILEDSKHRIWCGTQDGLSCLDPQTGTFFNVLNNEEISVNTLQEDKLGYIWAGTNIGLYKLEQTGRINQHFNRNTDLFNDCYTQRAKTIYNGLFFLGTSNGLVSFNPLYLDKIANSSRLQFTDIKINNISVYDEQTVTQTFRLNKDTVIVLPYNKNTISISFADLSWLNFNNGELYYRLEIADSSVKLSPTNREITYNNLMPGKYRFSIGYLFKGKYSSQKHVTFIIQKAWWTTIWFIILMTIFVVLVIISVISLRLRNIKNRNKVLKQLVENRTSELQIVNDILNIQNDTLNQRTIELEKLNETKNKLFSIIGHDLKNPMSAIIQLSELLYVSFDRYTNEKKKDLVRHINISSVNTINLLNKLLDWARTQQNVVSKKTESISIPQILNEIMELNTELLNTKGIKISVTNNSEYNALADKNMLQTCIRNVISNAIKYSFPKSVITIFIETTSDSSIQIKVQDSGIGMSEERLQQIFSINKASHIGTADEIGTGLGLIIVKEFIETMNGSITFESEENKGTLAILEIPSTLEAAINQSKSDIEIEPLLKSEVSVHLNKVDLPYLKGKQILIIDDDSDLRFVLKTLLEEYANFHEACDATAGLEMIIQLQPDLIICDVEMPGITGFELCDMVKKNIAISHIPFIMLTALDSNLNTVTGFLAGVDDYLTKPFSDEVLLLKISTILKTREQMRSHFSIENKDISEIVSNSADVTFLTKFMAIVNKDYIKPELSVEDIGDEVGFSRSQLYKKCMALTGKTPVDIIQEVRMQNALNLLKNTTLNISEIAYEVGYSDPKYFSSRFKKMIGKTPSEIRDIQGF